MSFSLITTFIYFLAPVFAPVFAEDIHGLFNVVKGEVKVISAKDQKTSAGKVGMKVFVGDKVTTGKEGRAKIVMSDKNVLNLSPDTKMVISRYETKGKDKNVEIKIEEGKVRASVEQKYDGDKSKFQIRTPSAVAGVRGTDFITRYEPASRQSQIITFTGTVAVANLGPRGELLKQVMVRPGESTSVKDGAAPEVPKALPPEQIKQMNIESKADSASAVSQNKSATGDGQRREPASTTSMVDSKDLSVEPGREVMGNSTPAVGSNFNPNQGVPLVPKQNSMINDASRNMKTKTTVIINNGK